MEKKDVIVLLAVAAVLGVKLYQKYYKKGNDGSVGGKKTSSGPSSFSTTKDDDYEPYKNK